MLVEAVFINPQTKQEERRKIIVEDNFFQTIEKEKFNEPLIEKNKLELMIDNMEISAEMKAILKKIATVTINFGKVALNVGLRLLDIIVFLMKKFPNATVGAIVGFLISSLITSIPLIGWVFGWLVPILTSAGFIIGAVKDITGHTISKEDIEDLFNSVFAPLKKAKLVNG